MYLVNSGQLSKICMRYRYLIRYVKLNWLITYSKNHKDET